MCLFGDGTVDRSYYGQTVPYLYDLGDPEDELLGAAAALTAAAGAASKLIPGIKKSKDPGRISTNERWEREARAGNIDALLALKYMSGKYGPNPHPIPGYCDRAGSCAGWGSPASKEDAHRRYLALKHLEPGAQAPPPPPTPIVAKPPAPRILPRRENGAALPMRRIPPIMLPATPATPIPVPLAPAGQEAIERAVEVAREQAARPEWVPIAVSVGAIGLVLLALRGGGPGRDGGSRHEW